MASKPKPRRMRGYDEGGTINDPPYSQIAGKNAGDRIGDAVRGGLTIANVAKTAGLGLGGGAGAAAAPTGAMGGGFPLARGGKIKHTAGPRIGKDDGLIPAQKGEYVVRKSAVKKLGTAALNQVNRGEITGEERPVKKPVRKRKGYDSGGIVSAGRRLYGQISDISSDRAQEDTARQAGLDRGAAKDYPGMYTNFQRADMIGDRMLARQGMPTKYPANQPEGYPAPHAKGGKVKKVMPVRKRR